MLSWTLLKIVLRFSRKRKLFLLAAANSQFIGCVTAKSSTDIYYLTHRVTHDNKATRDVLAKLFSIFEILDTAGMDFRKAIPSQISNYEDAIMIETAMRTETDCIVTRNIRDYSKAEIPVYTPSEFIQKLQESMEE